MMQKMLLIFLGIQFYFEIHIAAFNREGNGILCGLTILFFCEKSHCAVSKISKATLWDYLCMDTAFLIVSIWIKECDIAGFFFAVPE